jgi:Zn-dependent alcohol dehydrogenase
LTCLTGSGYVEKVGEGVTVAEVGDPVLLSFASCRQCHLCTNGHSSHCIDFDQLNFIGNKTFSSDRASLEDPDILGSFFGQSSFAALSIANESSVVNVKGLIESDDDLRLFAPLGCGIQTGSGTILNAAKATPQDTVAVIGAGGVGLSAIMGAKIAACKTIIVIDRVGDRLDLAIKRLGATHAINTSTMTSTEELVDQVRRLTGGYGTTITVDTTGVLPLIQKGLEFTARRGQYIQVGTTKPDCELSIPLQAFMCSGKRIIGAIEGQVIPQEYVPRMIKWYREGRFPIDLFVKEYAAANFDQAFAGMKSGTIIKPILRW